MKWEQIEATWDKVKGKFQEKWGKLTHDELLVIKGNKNQMIGKLKEKYGFSSEEAEKEINQFSENL